jgi:hypothetical protein
MKTNETHEKSRLAYLVLIALVVMLGTTNSRAAPASDPVLEWNSIMVTTTATQNPFFQARFAAITQLAVFEAVNAIDKEFEPYLGTITAPSGASADAAAVAAAHAVLENYFPGSASALDAAYAASLAGIRNGSAKQNGITVGEAAAAALIALRTGDGSAPTKSYLPTSSAAGQWQPTPSCPATGGILLQWATCARSRSRARVSFALRQNLRSRAGAMRAATTKSCASAASTARSGRRIAQMWPDFTQRQRRCRYGIPRRHRWPLSRGFRCRKTHARWR